MGPDLMDYRPIVGSEVIDHLQQTASLLKGKSIVHVNSTREGGGVAEILINMVPLTCSLGIDVQWHTIKGNDHFFRCTKMFHNLLQGDEAAFPSASMVNTYETTIAENARLLKGILQDADIVFIHDPQPLPLISHFPNRKGKWIWRCHIDLSAPSIPAWEYLKKMVECYDASIFSLKDFSQPFPHPIYFIPPSIDPLSEKNIQIDLEEAKDAIKQLEIDPERPILLQVSRFDRFKDQIGVLKSYFGTKEKYPNLQLVLAGCEASDDPEGKEYFDQVSKMARKKDDIHLLNLPSNSFRIINCLQTASTIVIQKSLKEGFGLTVSEALWKRKPVIGGNTGGIRLQIIDNETGFLVNSSKEATDRIDFLLQHPQLAQELGTRGQQHVLEHFLITRHLQDYLNVAVDLSLGR